MTNVPLLLRVALALGVLVGLVTYVNRRLGRWIARSDRERRTIGLFLALGPLLILAGRFGARLAPIAHGEPFALVYATGFTIAMITTFVAALLLPVDLLRGFAYLVGRLRGLRGRASVGGDAPPVPSVDPGPRAPEEAPTTAPRAEAVEADSVVPAPEALPRRELLYRAATGAALSIATGSALHGLFVGRHDYALEEHEVRLPKLSPRLEGYTVVQLSDIHVGAFVKEAEIRAALALVRRARPDLVVLTGDLVDHDIRYAPYLGRLVRALAPLARDGVAAIPGNHDYYAGIDGVVDTVRRAGGRMLRNQGFVIGDARDGVALLGVDDPWGKPVGGPGPDLAAALRDVPPDLPRVLLAHQPVVFADTRGNVELQLSGHTHGGQIALGYNPAEAVLPHGWVRGFYGSRASRLYVNRGFGTAGPPSRIGSPPEVTRLVLTAG